MRCDSGERLKVSEINDGETWNEALLQLPAPHVLQSWEWGEFKRGWGWAPTRLLFQAGGRTCAAAQLLRRPLSGLFRAWPLAVMYVPKGPLLADYDDRLLGAVLNALVEQARAAGAIFVKIDPDVELDAGAAFGDCLQRLGWRPSPEQIQFKNTLLVDLERSEEELLAAMKAKTRYNVRLAARRGVTVRAGGEVDLPCFYAMYAATAERDRFIIRPFDYYRDAWGRFLAAGLAHLLLAEVEGKPVAGIMLFRFASSAWYMYGASSGQYRNLMPNYLLQWEALRWAKAQGCRVYDLWGAPDVLEESDPLWGVYRFKEGLGGRLVRHIGAWDYPLGGPLYRLYMALMPRYLERLRRRQRTIVNRGAEL
jgi:peptidoglycan pentaglycine glycine transferase (the first glycine)